MKHTCHAMGCDVNVPEKMFLCRNHWFQLPRPMRDAVWAEYVPGQEISKTPTQEYLNVTERAIRWLAIKEGKIEARAGG